MRIEGKMSLRNVEDYASANMGLSKTEAYQIEYVQLNKGDRWWFCPKPGKCRAVGTDPRGVPSFWNT